MKRYVICAVDVEGFHRWPEAPDGELEYLRYRHRHVFTIRMEFEVQDGNREIEIVKRQHEIKNALWHIHPVFHGIVDFCSMSCEQIAEELLLHFDAAACTVLEDGYGGARVVR